MHEVIVSGIVVVLTAGAGWTLWLLIIAHLNMCEDIAAIKKEICGE